MTTDKDSFTEQWGETLCSTTYYRVALYRDYPPRLKRHTTPWQRMSGDFCSRYAGLGMAYLDFMPERVPSGALPLPDLTTVEQRFPISPATQLLYYQDGSSTATGDRSFTLVLHNPGRPECLTISYDE
jgi:hypothetical protein